MHRSYSNSGLPSHAQQSATSGPSSTTAHRRRNGPFRNQPDVTSRARAPLESLGILIDHTPGHGLPSRYSGYDPTVAYHDLSPQHRQLRDLLEVSDELERANARATSEMWERHSTQVAQGQRYPSNAVSGIFVGHGGHYNHPAIAFNQPPLDFAAHAPPVLPQNGDEVPFADLVDLPEGLDDGSFDLAALGYDDLAFDDLAFDLAEFGPVPLLHLLPEASGRSIPTPSGLRQYVAARGRPHVPRNDGNGGEEGSRELMLPPQSSSSSRRQFR